MYTPDIYNQQHSFSKTIMAQKNSSYDIDNASESQLYVNPDIKNFENSDMNITLRDNILLTKYKDRLLQSCEKIYFDTDMNIKYRYRPEAVSLDYYNTPILFYVVMFFNQCEDFSEFYDFDYILLPDINVINECLTNEEYINKKDIK